MLRRIHAGLIPSFAQHRQTGHLLRLLINLTVPLRRRRRPTVEALRVRSIRVLLLLRRLLLQHLFSLLVFVFYLFLAEPLRLPERVRHVYAVERDALILATVVKAELLQQLAGLDVDAVGRADRYRQFNLEELVLEALARGRPLVRIIVEHVLYQVDCVFACILDDGAQGLGQVLRKAVVQLVGQLEALWPRQLGGRAQDFADASHLVVLGLPREEGPHRVQFAHDGSKSKDINRRIVVRRAQQNFRGPVPPGGDVVGKGRLTVALLGQAKVRNLYGLIIAKQILRFQIPVEVVLLVHVGEALESLKEYVSDDVLRKQFPAVLHDFENILVEVLEDEVKRLVLQDDLLEVYDVRMGQLDQGLHFLLVHAGIPPVVALLHLLYGNDLAGLPVHRFDY